MRVNNIQTVAFIARQAIIDGFQQLHPQLPLLQRSRQIFDGFLIRVMSCLFSVIFRSVSRHSGRKILNGCMTIFEFIFTHRIQHTSAGERGNPHRQKQSGSDTCRPWLLPFNCPFNHNLRRQQRRVNPCLFQRLQSQSVRHSKGHNVVNKQRITENTVASNTLQTIKSFHGVFQVLLQEFLQPGHFESVADTDYSGNLGRPIDAAEISDRTLDLSHIVVKHRTHGLENGFGIRSFCRIAFQVLGFGECELHFTSQRASEMIAANRHVANPDVLTI